MTSNLFTISGTPTEAGTFNYTVTTEGPCENISLQGSITVNPAAVANIATEHQELEICYDGNAYNITAGASVENESSFLWSVPAGEGTINNPTSLTEATFTPSAEVSSPVTITLTAVGMDGCSDATATKQIVVNQKPLAPGVEPVVYCLNDDKRNCIDRYV
jgi:large repetitive protein